MADYRRIIARMPEVADFLAAQRSIRFRGDVLAYAPEIRCESFTTDGAGFRHSTLRGKNLSVRECLTSDRYGLILGASNTFGFGVSGNENIMASLLAERFGFPFANAAMPGANSRNLHSFLLAVLASATTAPAVVVHSSGGDLATFCASSLADPVYGSPNNPQRQGAMKEQSERADPQRFLPAMLAFTSLWSSALASLCRAYRTPLIFIHQSTFFEKVEPSETELEFGLGQPAQASQEKQFQNHRSFNQPFFERRKKVAEQVGVPLAGWGLTEELGFIDEFHCSRDAIRLLSNAVGDLVDAQLRIRPST